MKSELVSWRNGVSISEPTAMVSASMRVGHLPKRLQWGLRRARLLEETQAFHAQRHIINGGVGSHDGAARWTEGQTDDAAAADDDLRIVLWGAIDGQAQHPAPSAMRGGYIERPGDIDGHALRTAEAAIVNARAAVAVDGVDDVIAGCRGSRDEERAVETESQVIGGDAGLDRGEDENLAITGDLEDRAGAVSAVEIAFRIERQTGS